MRLWQLRTFCAVAKNLHFRRAAEDLNLSQPAVSHQIKSLEEEIGEPLFLREKDGILLTKAGQTMYEHANKILDIADEMQMEITDSEDVLSGTILIGVALRGLGNPFSLYYEDFKNTYNSIEVIFQNEQKLDDIVEKVRAGEIDIGIVSHNLDLDGLVVVPYGEYEMVLVVGKNHRLAGRKEVTPADLKNEEWVFFDANHRLRKSAEEFLKKAGIKVKNIYETNDGSFIRSMVVFGNKIALLPEWGVFEEIREGKIIPLKIKDSKCKIQVTLIWKASRRTKVMSAVITYLLEKEIEGIKLAEQKKRTDL